MGRIRTGGRRNFPTDYSKIRDLAKYRELVWLDRLWMLPGLLLAAACFALGGWGGLV